MSTQPPKAGPGVQASPGRVTGTATVIRAADKLKAQQGKPTEGGR